MVCPIKLQCFHYHQKLQTQMCYSSCKEMASRYRQEKKKKMMSKVKGSLCNFQYMKVSNSLGLASIFSIFHLFPCFQDPNLVLGFSGDLII